MRILYVNHTRKLSGAGLSLSTLLRHLSPEVERYYWIPSGCEIKTLLGAGLENTVEDRHLSQFPTTMYGAPYSLLLYAWHALKGIAAFPRLRSRLNRWQIDLVHINETTLLAYAFAAEWAGKPVVLHARTALKQGGLERHLIKRLSNLKKFTIIAIDEEVKQSFPDECKPLIQVVYNPIEIGPPPAPDVTRALREKWGFTPEDIVIGQVASLHSQKGIWNIIELAEKLCAEFDRLRFVLVGDKSPDAGEGPKLQALIEQKGLGNQVLLAGYHTDLPLVYSALDVALCLFGSGLGGVGRTAYEASLCGKALIATLPDPETSQTLENGKSGLLFPCDDMQGVETGIRRLIQDAPFRELLGKNAREVIGIRHDPRKIAEQVLGIYHRLLS